MRYTHYWPQRFGLPLSFMTLILCIAHLPSIIIENLESSKSKLTIEQLIRTYILPQSPRSPPGAVSCDSYESWAWLLVELKRCSPPRAAEEPSGGLSQTRPISFTRLPWTTRKHVAPVLSSSAYIRLIIP